MSPGRSRNGDPPSRGAVRRFARRPLEEHFAFEPRGDARRPGQRARQLSEPVFAREQVGEQQSAATGRAEIVPLERPAEELCRGVRRDENRPPAARQGRTFERERRDRRAERAEVARANQRPALWRHRSANTGGKSRLANSSRVWARSSSAPAAAVEASRASDMLIAATARRRRDVACTDMWIALNSVA